MENTMSRCRKRKTFRGLKTYDQKVGKNFLDARMRAASVEFGTVLGGLF